MLNGFSIPWGGKMSSEDEKPQKDDDGDEELIGFVAFGIRAFRNKDGTTRMEMQSQIQNLPPEIVIMRMKAFIRHLEKDFYDDYDSNTVRRSGN